MTFNEFKLICICFCRKYEGKTFGEVFPDAIPFLSEIKISIKNIRFDLVNEVYFRIDGRVLFRFSRDEIQYIKHVKNNDKNTARWSVIDMSLFDFDDIM